MECSFRITEWHLSGERYGCEGNITSSVNQTHLVIVAGTHAAGKTPADVEFFSILNPNSLTAIPKNIERFFPNLVAFRLINGDIQTVSSDDFEPFRNLLIIVLNSNKIVSLDSNLFQYTRSLRAVFFPRNLLQHVGHDLFTDLDDLSYAHFQNNTCVDFIAWDRAEVQEWNLKLPVSCPQLETTTLEPVTTTSLPVTTTTLPPSTSTLPPTFSTTFTISTTTPSPNQCNLRCSLNDESDLQSKKIEQLNDVVRMYEQRLVEVEMQLRELLSNPCSTCH